MVFISSFNTSSILLMAEAIFRKWELDFAVIGEVTDSGHMVLKFKGETVCDIPLGPLAEDAPTDDDVLPRCCYILCCVPPPNTGAGGDARYERVGDGESSGGESRRRDAGVPAMV